MTSLELNMPITACKRRVCRNPKILKSDDYADVLTDISYSLHIDSKHSEKLPLNGAAYKERHVMRRCYSSHYHSVRPELSTIIQKFDNQVPSNLEYDAMVCRGISGVLAGSILAVHTHKKLIVVRKTLQRSHASYLVEGYDRNGTLEITYPSRRCKLQSATHIQYQYVQPLRYLFVDDFMTTGETLAHTLHAMLSHWYVTLTQRKYLSKVIIDNQKKECLGVTVPTRRAPNNINGISAPRCIGGFLYAKQAGVEYYPLHDMLSIKRFKNTTPKKYQHFYVKILQEHVNLSTQGN